MTTEILLNNRNDDKLTEEEGLEEISIFECVKVMGEIFSKFFAQEK